MHGFDFFMQRLLHACQTNLERAILRESKTMIFRSWLEKYPSGNSVATSTDRADFDDVFRPEESHDSPNVADTGNA